MLMLHYIRQRVRRPRRHREEAGASGARTGDSREGVGPGSTILYYSILHYRVTRLHYMIL